VRRDEDVKDIKIEDVGEAADEFVEFDLSALDDWTWSTSTPSVY